MGSSRVPVEAIIYILIICVIWIFYYIAVHIYHKKFGRNVKNYESLYVVHNKCYSFSARNVYLIKLFYGKHRKNFFFLSTIILEFFDDKNSSILIFEIPPTVLFGSRKEHVNPTFNRPNRSNANQLAIILQTKKSLTNANELRISHTCNTGDLFIYETKIIDLISNETWISRILSWIGYLTPGAHDRAQMFVVNQWSPNQPDIKPSPYASFPEMLLFFLVGIHWILFHTQYIICSMKSLEFYSYYENMEMMLITGLTSAFFAFIWSTLSLIIYSCFVKRLFSELSGIGIIYLIKILYLFFIVIASLVLGLSAIVKPDLDKSNASSSHLQLKWLAAAIAIVIHSLIYFILGYSRRSFRPPKEDESLNTGREISESSINKSKRTSKRTESVQSIQELGSGVDRKNNP